MQPVKICFSESSGSEVWMPANTGWPVYIYTHTCACLTALFAGTTQVSRYRKGKTNLDFTEATESEWQWHLLGHITTPAPHHSVFYRPDALPAAQPTASVHWRGGWPVWWPLWTVVYVVCICGCVVGFAPTVPVHNEAYRERWKCGRHCDVAVVWLSIHPAHV